MAKVYKIQIDDGKGTDIQPVRIEQGVGDKGGPIRLVAQKSARYELQQERKDGANFAPDQLRVQRKGKNLQIWFDGSKQPDVVIEGYYEDASAMPTLMGVAENGRPYEYVPQDPHVNSLPVELKDGGSLVAVALGGTELPAGFALAALPLVAAAGGVSGWALAGGAVALGAAAGGGGGGGSGGATPPDNTAPGKPLVALSEANDGFVNATEASDGTPVVVTLPTDAIAGDTLTTEATKPDGSKLILTHVLTDQDIKAKAVTFTIPASELENADGKWLLSTTVKDAVNNVSDPVASSFDLDTLKPSFQPVDAVVTANSVAENIPVATVVHTASATDTASPVKYSLKEGASDNAAFSINATNGQVTFINSPNFEVKNSYTLVVVATDGAGNTAEQTVNLSVTNVDDVAPTFTSPATVASVSENIPTQTIIYTAKAKDIDFISPATIDTVTYRLKAGDDAALFTIDAITGVVKLKGSPNFETKHSYTFTVEAVDAVENCSEINLKLNVLDMPEAALLSFQVSPGTFTGINPISPILTYELNVFDEDAGQSGLFESLDQTGTYGTFKYLSSTPAAGTGNVFNWQYTLVNNPALVALNGANAVGHDLQVLRSLDGTAYKTVDILVNADATSTKQQIFNAVSTEGLTVNGKADFTDTLSLHGIAPNTLTLDLTLATSAAAKLTSVEHINLSDPQNYTVKLNLASVTQAQTDGGVHKLWIEGSTGDTVILVHQNLLADNTTVSGYSRYVLDNTHELLVQQFIAVQYM